MVLKRTSLGPGIMGIINVVGKWRKKLIVRKKKVERHKNCQ